MKSFIKARSILVVDDDASVVICITMRLKQDGYENVRVATSGREALGLVKRCVPDLVITDLRMSGGSGVEFIDALNDLSSETASPPMVICVSGFMPDDLTPQQAFRKNVVAYFHKPFDLDDLASAVNLFLKWKERSSPSESLDDLDSVVSQHRDTIKRLRCVLGSTAEKRPEVLSILRELSAVEMSIREVRSRFLLSVESSLKRSF